MQSNFDKELIMAGTSLKRKARRNRVVAKKRMDSIQKLQQQPVIKNVDVEAIKEEFKKNASKKKPAAKKEDTAKAEEKKEAPKAKKTTTKKAETKKTEDKPKASKKSEEKKED